MTDEAQKKVPNAVLVDLGFYVWSLGFWLVFHLSHDRGWELFHVFFLFYFTISLAFDWWKWEIN